MVIGAKIAFFKDDLKALLAFSTVSHLGLITMLLGMAQQRPPLSRSSTSSTTRPSRPRSS
jgi:NADH:ubiquinone oxidoreductase subunit 5 (subunit L)/multisubunit Na+/H+ antiporter MnhA subunit